MAFKDKCCVFVPVHAVGRGRADSIHPTDWAYVFFRPEQVLPVYVLHLHSRISDHHKYHVVTAGGNIAAVAGTQLSQQAQQKVTGPPRQAAQQMLTCPLLLWRVISFRFDASPVWM